MINAKTEAHIVSNLSEFPRLTDKTLGKLLVEAGKLRVEDVEVIVRYQREKGLRFGEAGIRLGLVQETDVLRMLARQFDYPCLQPGEHELSDELIAAYAPFGSRVEALRQLRSQLKLRWFGDKRNTLAVVGLNRGDGCSFIAANLAVVFSQMGERTLLIDANLRNPRQHQIFGLAHRQGLSDLLAGRCSTEVIIQIAELADLDVLPAGPTPPNPQELLVRSSFKTLLRRMGQAYDVVLLDTPAGSLYADSQLIAMETLAALLIVRKHRSRIKDLEAVKKRLTEAGTEWVGAAFNDI
ncbi:chain length determinant protein tyrosine kinase EpsG [Methylocaldum szegediense]|uniref:Chain length determinant protein tyrosine kinase EpsG n=1 Tax=Methylocaldum szegediense TaxID=73780 RepID=A0ABN8X9N2_9GAMM|nr:chain length determinant protein tyrosine kinase EpsG [Methylocaldum szegediense]CAI8925982.1 Chain length determinant protein tyrosine kinase EpsG [Methylocaldum szegediense]